MIHSESQARTAATPSSSQGSHQPAIFCLHMGAFFRTPRAKIDWMCKSDKGCQFTRQYPLNKWPSEERPVGCGGISGFSDRCVEPSSRSEAPPLIQIRKAVYLDAYDDRKYLPDHGQATQGFGGIWRNGGESRRIHQTPFVVLGTSQNQGRNPKHVYFHWYP